ncbi:hypothetical protein FRC07_006730, partial [Ceratobasidium sp. 392]
MPKSNQRTHQSINFYTGTPTFASPRVLSNPIGPPYRYSFMDGLESFFWLMIWYVLERVEFGDANSEVNGILNRLDQPNLEGVTIEKSSLLAKCVRDDGKDMKDVLARCRNGWATDPMIAELIVEMDTYFYHISRKRVFHYIPNQVFPKLVKMGTDVLDQPG